MTTCLSSHFYVMPAKPLATGGFSWVLANLSPTPPTLIWGQESPSPWINRSKHKKVKVKWLFKVFFEIIADSHIIKKKNKKNEKILSQNDWNELNFKNVFSSCFIHFPRQTVMLTFTSGYFFHWSSDLNQKINGWMWSMGTSRGHKIRICWVLVCFSMHHPKTSVQLAPQSGNTARFSDVMTLFRLLDITQEQKGRLWLYFTFDQNTFEKTFDHSHFGICSFLVLYCSQFY